MRVFPYLLAPCSIWQRTTITRMSKNDMNNVAGQSLPLTNEEFNLFSLLIESLRYHKKSTVARVAGGWVRDKLLGRESNDIDIALDDQLGEEFANNVNEYLTAIGESTRSIAIIQANPDQSKHLQTANLKVLNFEIDCVNLRAETYTSDSRIPEIRFGTPSEDAMRRDFTINSLFYNLNSRIVEDLTDYGLQDLRDGILRTPLPPFETFRDDPLRVLRAVRFASRFNFTFHPDIESTASNPVIVRALQDKVSRERVLKEIEGMFASVSSRPFLAITMLHRLSILDSVLVPSSDISRISTRGVSQLLADLDLLTPPSSSATLSAYTVSEELDRAQTLSFETARWCNILLTLVNYPDSITKLGTDTRTTRLPGRPGGNLNLTDLVGAQLLLVSRDAQLAPQPGSRVLFWAACTTGLNRLQFAAKKRQQYLPIMTLQECLKMDGDTLKQVWSVHEGAQGFRDLLRAVGVADSGSGQNLLSVILSHADDPLDEYLSTLSPHISFFRMQLGLILRGMAVHTSFGAGLERAAQLWRVAVLLACAEDIAREELRVQLSPTDITDITISQSTLSLMDRYGSLQRTVEVLGLDGSDSVSPLAASACAWNIRPVLDGNRLVKVLGLAKGPQMGQMLEAQVRWQLRQPTGTVAQCVEHLKQVLASLPVIEKENTDIGKACKKKS